MSLSRSHFYVETPTTPSQRHSMFVTHPEIDPHPDLSAASSSATLPSTAGSVDRLDKKSSRSFFTLKPKAFSLRPFASLASLSSSKRRPRRSEAEASRRDSYCQTEPSRGEVGVQTQIASTVDVPVQTCSGEWEETSRRAPFRQYTSWRPYDTCFERADGPAISTRCESATGRDGESKSAGVSENSVKGVSKLNSQNSDCGRLSACLRNTRYTTSNALKDSSNLKNPFVVSDSGESQNNNQSGESSLKEDKNFLRNKKPLNDPLASPKLLKYAAPSNSFSLKTSLDSKIPVESSIAASSTSISRNVCDPSQDNAIINNGLPDEKLTNINKKQQTVLISGNTESPCSFSACDKKNSDSALLAESSLKSKESDENILSHTIQGSNRVESGEPSKRSETTHLLRSERTDSPSKSKQKSVHFNLPNSETASKETRNDLNSPRNIDDDFIALLRDLDILTEEPEETEQKLPVSSPLPDSSKKNLHAQDLKSAFDFLRQDFLAPILETSAEATEVYNTSEKDSPIHYKESIEIAKTNELSVNSFPDDVLKIDKHETSTPVTVHENKQDHVKDASLKFTSQAAFSPVKFKSDSEQKTSCNRENVYNLESEGKQNKPSNSLPIPPNFFRSPPESSPLPISEAAEFPIESSPVSCENRATAMPLDSDFEKTRISRSSSRNSVQSESKPSLDTMYESFNPFQSCDNLSRMEEKLIDNLRCPPERELLAEKYSECQSVAKSPDIANIDSTRMRRVILDRLLSGESIDDIVLSKSFNEHAEDFTDSKRSHKIDIDFTTKVPSCDDISVRKSSDLDTYQMDAGNPQSGTLVLNCNYKHDVDSPKKTSVFLFPDVTFSSACAPEKSNFEIATAEKPIKVPADLEVRRSSWSVTPDITSSISVAAVSLDEFPSKGQIQDTSKECDFSSCLQPSQMQNSSFLSEVQPASAKPHLHPSAKESVFHSGHNPGPEVKSNPPTGQCDYASCLKPSQVQNSVFTAALSEITASRSSNIHRDALRTSTPLTSRTNSPCLSNATNTYVAGDDASALEDTDGEVYHKSEIIINLKPYVPKKEHFLGSEVLPEIKSPSNSLLVQQANSGTQVDTNSQSQVTSFKDKCEEFLIGEKLDSGLTSFSSKETETNVPAVLEVPYKQTPFAAEESVDVSQPISIPPPPPPPPPPTFQTNYIVNRKEGNGTESLQSLLTDRHSNLAKCDSLGAERASTPKSPIMAELEKRFQNSLKKQTEDQITTVSEKLESDSQSLNNCSSGRHYANNVSASQGQDSLNNSDKLKNGNDAVLLDHRFRSSSLPENHIGNGSSNGKNLTFSSNTIVTNEPPPPGAVLLDKKVTVDGDQVHTDKFYAIPVKEILKEKISTTTFIPAPPKYEGIGPTEDGIPIGLRNSVKKENMHNWYKTMFKNLHKADSSNDSQEYLIGYSSEPETSTREKMMRKKSSTLDNRQKQDGTNINLNKHQYPPSAKSSIEVYNVRPRLIEDYEPGYSSIADDKPTPGLKRFLPAMNVPKPSYEFKNGYESDNTLLKKAVQPPPLSPTQQKIWYREVQQGGEIPPLGLGKVVPEKPKETIIGPVPPPPLNYRVQQTFPQATRPLTLPATYMNQNGNGVCHQANGHYEVQMRSAIHSELQQRMSPTSNQLSPSNRQGGKSPSKSPDLKLPARALFDFKAETNKEIPLKKGDVVLVLRQLDKNWYEGQHLGVTGIFPISYVEIIPPEHAVLPTKSVAEGLGRALFDFSAQTSVELSFKKGDTLALLRRVDSNWYEARFNNKKGILPASYIQVLQQPEKSFESPTSPMSGLSSPVGKIYSPVRITTELDRSSKHSSNSVSPHSASPVNRNERERLLNHNLRSSNLIEPVMYRAMYSYNPQNSDELELQEGDMVCVVEVCDDGWYVGTSARTGVFGIFPGNYVEKA